MLIYDGKCLELDTPVIYRTAIVVIRYLSALLIFPGFVCRLKPVGFKVLSENTTYVFCGMFLNIKLANETAKLV